MNLSLYDLSTLAWVLFFVSGLLIGLSKAGLSGVGLLIVPVMAKVFGGKPSVGIVLPMLIVADIFAVRYYHRHAEWKYIIKLLPWALIGIAAGLFTGNLLNDDQFSALIAVLVIVGIVLMLWQDFFKKKITIPDYWWFSALLGFAGGFTTMVGNAAGPIMAMYLLSMRLPKNSFIGTGAWFFLIINLCKVPLHIFVWRTIHWTSFGLNVIAIPVIIVGALFGIYIVKLIPEKAYRIFIIISTILSAGILLMK